MTVTPRMSRRLNSIVCYASTSPWVLGALFFMPSISTNILFPRSLGPPTTFFFLTRAQNFNRDTPHLLAIWSESKKSGVFELTYISFASQHGVNSTIWHRTLSALCGQTPDLIRLGVNSWKILRRTKVLGSGSVVYTSLFRPITTPTH